MKNTLKTIIFSGLFALPFIVFLVSGSLFFPFITTKGFVFRLIIEIVFAAWILLALGHSEYRLKRSAVVYSIGAFLIIIALADAFGAAPLKSFWSNAERMEGYITLIHLGMMFAVMASFFKELDWRRWWNTSLVASFIMVIYCAFQLAGGVAIHQGGARVDGTLGNAAYLAVYMLFHIFVAMFLFLKANKNKGLRWTYGILILLLTWILYHTATRGAILGLLFGLFIMSILNIRNKNNRFMRIASIWILSGLVVVSGGFLLLRNSSFVQDSPVLLRFAAISTEELKSGGRSFVWPMAVKGILERPILGWGQENFNYVFNEHYSPEMYKLEPWFDRAHNIFLDWGISGGILGLASYLSLYIVLLWLLWKYSNFTFEERSIITGLVGAYFVHNLFVFDQLISYILFFSLLAYVHSKSLPDTVSGTSWNSTKVLSVAVPIVVIALIPTLYFFDIKPIVTNASLIEALQITATPQSDKNQAIAKFHEAYNGSYLGRAEIVEQIGINSPTILTDNSIPIETRNDFFDFSRGAITKLADSMPNDARYQILAGSYLGKVGVLDEADKYLARAQELIPGKQLVYFEWGSTLLNQNDNQGALKLFKEAYDLAPEYDQAKLAYLIGAIYAGDSQIEAKMRSELENKTLVFDDRVLSAYYTVGRKEDAIALLRERIALDPTSTATYTSYIQQIENSK